MSEEGKLVLIRDLRRTMNEAAALGIVDGPDVFGVQAKLLAETIGRMSSPAERAARISEFLFMLADAVEFEAGNDTALIKHDMGGSRLQ